MAQQKGTPRMSRLAMVAALNPDSARKQIRKALLDAAGDPEGPAAAAARSLGCSYETLLRVAKALGLAKEMPRRGLGAGRPHGFRPAKAG